MPPAKLPTETQAHFAKRLADVAALETRAGLTSDAEGDAARLKAHADEGRDPTAEELNALNARETAALAVLNAPAKHG